MVSQTVSRYVYRPTPSQLVAAYHPLASLARLAALPGSRALRAVDPRFAGPRSLDALLNRLARHFDTSASSGSIVETIAVCRRMLSLFAGRSGRGSSSGRQWLSCRDLAVAVRLARFLPEDLTETRARRPASLTAPQAFTSWFRCLPPLPFSPSRRFLQPFDSRQTPVIAGQEVGPRRQ